MPLFQKASESSFCHHGLCDLSMSASLTISLLTKSPYGRPQKALKRGSKRTCKKKREDEFASKHHSSHSQSNLQKLKVSLLLEKTFSMGRPSSRVAKAGKAIVIFCSGHDGIFLSYQLSVLSHASGLMKSSLKF